MKPATQTTSTDLSIPAGMAVAWCHDNTPDAIVDQIAAADRYAADETQPAVVREAARAFAAAARLPRRIVAA